ncbi:MAG: multidrug efflux RND transporter permease subunit [Proteobacteria bacterium]|uniref:multidrug efflux RND transporter permease subunit n=1 Tax=Rudaea sp. TaxID=2136325 RepID=UPI001D842402|nr:multidrug efflux RND transporter permease subunit [Pseudomonadota bacterium]MBS0565876.1 multidrug efflux RND transporter permease subunit [Pseudomonadota bacterium]
MPNFFIDRPIFAWVVAILITLGGVISITQLGIESYPSIAPPQVVVAANYQGADASTVEKTVTQVIEQQLTGIDNLAYFSSSSGSDGSATITLTFEPGTNADIAQVQTQNKVSLATPRLPSEVTQQGIVVAKQNPDFLMVAMLKSDDGSLDSYALNNMLAASVIPQIQRLPGVGNVRQFGSEYAMRIWLDADKLKGYNMAAAQALAAVRAQNVQVAAGSLGAEPAVPGNGFSATVTAESRFTTPAQFEDIILRANKDGTTVRLKDVARVELGPFVYGTSVTYNGQAVAGFAVQLQTGANALGVGKAVKTRLAELQQSFPHGVSWFVPYDTTPFITISIEEVVQTLVEAIILVFLVMLVFLQNLRMTIIALLVIPVALMGGFLGMWMVGFTINQLSLFGMVLVIGIVVDDAIVVIENVERIMAEEGASPRDATRKAMGQISGAVVAIAVVLMAVFIPSALQSGSAGAIFRQFCLTIALSTAFSAFLALMFTPALCATILEPLHATRKNAFFRLFNRVFDRVQTTYTGHIFAAIRHMPRWMALFAVVAVLCGFAFAKLPSSFVPEEDQGFAFAVVLLPSGSSLERTKTVMGGIGELIRKNEAVEGVIAVSGFSFVGNGENTGMAFIRLKPWSERKNTAAETIRQLNGALSTGFRDAQAFVVNLPTIRGLGQFGGFDMYLQDRAGAGYAALLEAQNTLLGKAGERKDLLTGVRPNGLPPTTQLAMKVDRVQAQAMGLSLTDVYTAIQLMLAPVYANDFFYQGRVQRVNMQADAPFRMNPDALNRFFVPSSTQSETVATSTGTATLPAMIPLSNVVSTEWKQGPPTLTRYNGYSAIEIVGAQAPGRSSGEAMAAMQNIIRNDLPNGFGFDWTGQSLQEIISGNQAPMLYALSILIVFLCLAALYESWSVPISVLLVVPLGVLGAVSFTWARGLSNDVYFKIGIITIIGLAAKNAILIVEFAVAEQRAGRHLGAAVVDAARLRLRPILMTSFAFILGVFPLAVSTGAGANSRHAIGTGVIGGMLFATFFGLLFIPIFYVAMRRLLGDEIEPREEPRTQLDPSAHGGRG